MTAPIPETALLKIDLSLFVSSVRFQHDFDAAILFVAERLVHAGTVFEPLAVGYHKRRIDLAFLDATEEVVGPAIDVSLAGANCETLIHHHSDRKLVDQSAVHAWN